MSYGNAVERQVAKIIRDDEMLSRLFEYRARPFVETPDFFAIEGPTFRMLDITTEGEIPKKLLKPYGPYTDYVTHPGLPDNIMFTP
jgi:hypothetical protein